MYQEEKSLNLS